MVPLIEFELVVYQSRLESDPHRFDFAVQNFPRLLVLVLKEECLHFPGMVGREDLLTNQLMIECCPGPMILVVDLGLA